MGAHGDPGSSYGAYETRRQPSLPPGAAAPGGRLPTAARDANGALSVGATAVLRLRHRLLHVTGDEQLVAGL